MSLFKVTCLLVCSIRVGGLKYLFASSLLSQSFLKSTLFVVSHLLVGIGSPIVKWVLVVVVIECVFAYFVCTFGL